jgi:large subunit ribosomal protein L32
MPNPKRRHSSTRRDKRRTHDKVEIPTFYIDQQSGEPTLYHRVNLDSGYYRGRQVMKGRSEE